MHRVRSGREDIGEIQSQAEKGHDAGERDQGGDQPIFYRGRAAFVPDQSCKQHLGLHEPEAGAAMLAEPLSSISEKDPNPIDRLPRPAEDTAGERAGLDALIRNPARREEQIIG